MPVTKMVSSDASSSKALQKGRLPQSSARIPSTSSKQPSTSADAARAVSISKRTAETTAKAPASAGRARRTPGRSEGVSSAVPPSTRMKVEACVTIGGDEVLTRLGNPTSVTRSLTMALQALFGLSDVPGAGVRLARPSGALRVEGEGGQALSRMQKAHLAKRIANACLKSLNDLVVAGWKPVSTPASAFTGQVRTAPASNGSRRAAPTSSSKQRPAVSTAFQAEAPSQTVTSEHVSALLDCCGLALTYLAQEVEPATRGTELISARCTAIRKLVGLELGRLAAGELDALRQDLIAACNLGSDADSHLQRSANERWVLFRNPGNVALEVQPHILDALTLGANCALQAIEAPALEAYLEVLREPEGVLAWLRAASENPASKLSVDRPAFALERALRAALVRMEQVVPPSSPLTFEARAIGLEALLCVSDLKTEAFLGMAARVGAAHYQACSDEARPAAFQRMDMAFGRWLDRLGPDVLRKQGFAKFADTWLSYARHAKNRPAVDRIARLLSSSTELEGAEDQPPARRDAASADLRIARCVAMITKAVVAFDTADGKVPEASVFDPARTSLDGLGLTCLHASDDGREQLLSAVGRLCRRMLDAMSVPLADGAMSALVRSYITFAVRHLRMPGGPPATPGMSAEDMLHDVCDAGRFFASSTMKASGMDTHDAAQEVLTQVGDLCASESLPVHPRAKQAYNVSTTWYQLGVKLYQERQAGAAVAFLERSCEVGEMSERLYKEERVEEDKDKRADAAVRRYDVLSSALRLAQQHTRAVEASVKALRAVRPPRWIALANASNVNTLSQIFGNTAHLQLANIVTSLQHVSTFSLLRSQGAQEPQSVLAILRAASVPGPAVGVLLEQCHKTLEGSAHREEAPKALMETLQSALEMYDAQAYPLRRARVLLRQLESGLLLGLSSYEDVEETRAQVTELLSVGKRANDEELLNSVPELKVQLSLLMLCASHRASRAHAIGNMARDAHEAARHLELLLSSRSQKAPLESEKGVLKDSLSRQVNVPLRTPPRRKPMALPLTPPTSESSPAKRRPFEDSLDKDRLLSILALTERAIVAGGNSVASVTLLCAIWKLHSSDMFGATAMNEKLSCSTILAEELLGLGLHTEAQEVLRSMDRCPATPKVRFNLLLIRAKVSLGAEKYQDAVSLYEEAILAAGAIEAPPPKSSNWTMALERSAANLRYAQAAEVYSLIRQGQGDGAGAIQAAVEGVRCSARAVTIMSRICASPKSSKTQDEVKQIDQLLGPPASVDGKLVSGNECTAADGVSTQEAAQIRLGTHSVANLYWRVVRCASAAYSHACMLYDMRGSAKDAEMFATETVNFCKPLGTPVLLAKALMSRARIRSAMKQHFLANHDLQEAADLLGNAELPETCMLAATSAAMSQGAQRDAALVELHDASMKLEIIVTKVLQCCGGVIASPSQAQRGERNAVKRQTGATTKRKTLATEARSSDHLEAAQSSIDHALLRTKVEVLLRQVDVSLGLERLQQADDKLAQLTKLAKQSDACSQAQISFVGAQVAVRRALQQLQADQVLSLISETTISFSNVTDRDAREAPHLGRTVASLFSQQASRLLDMLSGTKVAHAVQTRRAMSLLVDVTALANTLMQGGHSDGTADRLVKIAAAASAVTIGRELLEAVDTKVKKQIPVVGASAPQWLQFAAPSASKPASRSRPILVAGRAAAVMQDELCDASTSDEESDDDVQAALNPSRKNRLSEKDSRSYWEGVRQRHACCVEEAVRVEGAERPDLPGHWTVITITLSPDESSLIVGRQRGAAAQAPTSDVAFRLPLDRHSRREGEEEELSMAAALAELKDVVDTSNRATQEAKDLQGVDARRQWWQNRMRLDARIKDLVEAIEQRWLGPFKGIFFENEVHVDDLASLRASWDSIFRRACFGASGSKRGSRVKVPDAVLDCFLSLPPTCTDEELEDLLHFIIDSFQFSDVPIAVDEVDFDHTVVQLRAALETFRGKVNARSREGGAGARATPAPHLFLVLDKDTCALPWESMPCIRGQAVSRIPSLAFLQDRIELSRLTQSVKVHGEGAFTLGTKPSAYYLLNPSGELTRTQERFEPWLKSRKWNGDAAHVPIADAFSAGLATKDLVLYFGHSGAEQFARSQAIRSLKRCAVTMLWGCSSGVLRDQGDYDRAGTPYNYMLAGCPALVANLWDATDRELDGVAESVFVKCGLMQPTDVTSADAEKQNQQTSACPNSAISLTQAVNTSRDACKLPYLTGAAVVVYGVPVYF